MNAANGATTPWSEIHLTTYHEEADLRNGALEPDRVNGYSNTKSQYTSSNSIRRLKKNGQLSYVHNK
jgi:hypothetical protein